MIGVLFDLVSMGLAALVVLFELAAAVWRVVVSG
jgi:hypothetical protein